MARKTVYLLTPEQRQWLTMIPADLTEREIALHYTFSPAELQFIRQRRNQINRLGLAVQIAVLHFPGFALPDIAHIPDPVLGYIAEQTHTSPSHFRSYPIRENTLNDHLKDIRESLGYRPYGWSEMLLLTRQLLPRALESEQRLPLIEVALQLMRSQKIIAPAVSTLERLVWNAHRIARWIVHDRLTHELTPHQVQTFQQVLRPIGDLGGKTPLAWLRYPPGTASIHTLNHVLSRILYLEALQLPPLPTSVPVYRLREMAIRCRQYQAQALSLFKSARQQAYLITYLHHLYCDLIDQAWETFDMVISELLRKGERVQEKQLRQHAGLLTSTLHTLTAAAEAFLQAKNEQLDPYTTVFAAVTEDQLLAAIQAVRTHARPADLDFLDLIETRYVQRRKTLLFFYQTLHFRAVREPHPALQALQHILWLAARKRRVTAVEQSVPLEPRSRRQQRVAAPLRHLSRTRWLKHTLKQNHINPNYYEIAAFDRLKASVRAGDIAILGSRRFQEFDSYLLPAAQWQNLVKTQATRLALTSTASEYLSAMQRQIETGLLDIQHNLSRYSDLTLSPSGQLHLAEPELEESEERRTFSRQVAALMPQMQLTDLLLEVDAWTGFLRHFTHLTDGLATTGDQKMRLVAALMGLGMNIGLEKMALATPFSYKQLSHLADWHIREETLHLAQADLDNFVLRLPISQFWGDGTASSSDGMRLAVGVESLSAHYNARYFGYRRGVTIVTHVADIWMPFAQRVISTSDREALYVIDALCHHRSDFDIREHYTDTGGYSYHVFAICAFLGFYFAPQLRSLTDQYLFSVDPIALSSPFDQLLKAQVHPDLIQDNWSEMQRLVASIGHGTVSAPLIMHKLSAYPLQNQLARAFYEMGKLERTLFILSYLRDPALRHRIRIGLNKGESLHRLARALFMAHSGEFRERDREAQLHRASALMLLIAAIATWNAVYLQAAIQWLQTQGTPITQELIAHLSPLRWEHINFLGQYHFNPAQARSLDNLRPLKSDSRLL